MSHDLSFAAPFNCHEPCFCGLKIKLHRNLSGYLFPSKISANDKTKLSSFVSSTLKQMMPTVLDFDQPLPSDIKETFSDIHAEAKSFFIDSEQKTTYSLLDQDHLVITCHTHEKDSKKLYELIGSIEKALSSYFHFSFHEKAGYLTSQPEHSGLGIVLEAFFFCPLLETDPQLEAIFSFEPYFQDESIYVLRTKKTMNLDLATLLQKFIDASSIILKCDAQSRDVAIKIGKDTIIDQVSKSLAILKGAYQLNFKETLEHLLNLKLGFHMGLLDGLSEDNFLRLLNQSSRAQLKDYYHQDSKDDWLHERALWIKEKLSTVNVKV
jgi:protein arginine kinase